ncbi:hypothetical protein [Nocardioides daphniae]|uniref:Uncharacterized protein n=1 Tax=Nocardioides daphniae TaxID=402297 RepID=A0A4P7U7L7_9ACTN|nr:hypothetical protein [Nocardioides daphniae]QCC76142.1 hypothetical protein E2C04_01085 [Nocardioides daphniae]GGD09697.1 hypothetical protein GCM10007231_05700 [Nocardioides daphniae]
MSDSHLIGRLTGGPFWQLVKPVMGEGEESVHFAQLRCAQGTEEMSGALFLTSHQLIWRTIDPRKPEGSSFEVALSDVIGVEEPTRMAAFHAFRIVTEHEGLPLDTYFFPQHRTDVDKLLCHEMFDAVRGAWTQHRSIRFSA